MYPLLVNHYGTGLTTPTGLKMANMAVFLTKDLSALPGGTRVRPDPARPPDRAPRHRRRPGLDMVETLPGTYDRYRFTLVAGLVAGDALISSVVVPILASLGVPLSP